MNVQEEVMHWIFGNEDRVWRYRGGRDGYETIDQYLRFLPHLRSGDPKAERYMLLYDPDQLHRPCWTRFLGKSDHEQ